jgi:F-type H+-transporting ATPase subunit a
MHLSPDQIVFWQHGLLKLNGTIVFTWALMLLLAVGSRLITRKLSTGLERSRWHNLLEIVVTGIEKQIQEVGLSQPQKYLGFLGTLFLFVATASLCTVIPGFQPPTASLSTTAALALSVFVAVPFFGIEEQGLGEYLKSYTKPTFIMLPFNIISRHPAHDYALHISDFYDDPRPAHRNGAGLHFQHPGSGLHRGRHASP